MKQTFTTILLKKGVFGYESQLQIIECCFSCTNKIYLSFTMKNIVLDNFENMMFMYNSTVLHITYLSNFQYRVTTYPADESLSEIAKINVMLYQMMILCVRWFNEI